jgi:hypothetical protein
MPTPSENLQILQSRKPESVKIQDGLEFIPRVRLLHVTTLSLNVERSELPAQVSSRSEGKI